MHKILSVFAPKREAQVEKVLYSNPKQWSMIEL